MKRTSSFSPAPTGRETVGGFVYLVFQILFLPRLLHWCNGQLGGSLNSAEVNFVYYLVNFIAILLIFHTFLGRNLNQATQHPAYFCQAVILGLAAYYACSWATSRAVSLLVPGFRNYNNEAISAMAGSQFFMTAVVTVILAPPVEECLYRGLIFRNLYGKSRWAAYIVSILAFAMIHIIGYIGRYSPVELIIAFLQYLPAGLCLAWAYIRSDTVFAPIVIHAAINFVSIHALR